SPGKRRKYGNDDEKLPRFWNALKGGKVEEHNGSQFLELSGDVYYLLGKDKQGSDISTLFICECYHHLSNIIFENENICRWHITGNPEIGKTFFGYYLLYLLSQQHYLGHEEVWYIVDGREPMEYVAKTILICSPQKRHYSSFDKLGTTIRYMPVWSWEEIEACSIKLFSSLPQEY
ncbi:5369_t:CDS:2, partial [Acaulospora morrowiae]